MHPRVVAILISAWLLAGCMRPAPVAPGATTAASTPAAQQSAPAAAAVPPSPGETPAPTPAPANSSPLFPGLDLALEVDLPAGPAAGAVYTLSLDPTFGSEAAAQNFAGIFDVRGTAYRGTGSSAGFLFVDGRKRFHVSGSDPRFELMLFPPLLLPDPNCAAPCLAGGALAGLESDLKDRGVLNFDYRLQPSPNIPHRIDIWQLVDGAALITPLGPALTALTDENGDLAWLQGTRLTLEAGRKAALRDAGQAWQALLEGSAGVIFREYPAGASQPRSWNRRYPTGSDRVVYGEAQVYEPVAKSGEQLILLNGYAVEGAVQGLAQAAAGGRILEVWGRADEDAAHGPRLVITSWQASVFPSETVEGRLAWFGRDAYLEDGAQRFFLPAAPQNIPEGAWLTAQGVKPIAEIPTIDWWRLTEGPAERVRISGPGLQTVHRAAAGADGTTPVSPERMDGTMGILQVLAHAFSDGSSQVEVQFEPQDTAWPHTLRLDGAGLQGIEAYHNLPVRIWGQTGETSAGLTTIEVERFEPVYPNLGVEAWLGMAEQAEAGGKPVWLLTTPDGESFVLASTLAGQPPAVEPALLRDPIIVEGVQIPGNTLLDFPIIDDLRIAPGVGRNDLEGYRPVSAQPRMIQEPGAAGARRAARIEAVELVYVLITETGQLAPTVNAAALAQPAWRFSGRFEDGASFEIYVQALFDV